MKNSKEKAFEIYFKFYRDVIANNDKAKQCALIAVDEMIETVNMCIPYQNEETYVKYWQEVKQEIELL